MSSKSAIKLVVPKDAPGTLYKWVALLTGSKNAIKGLGFFVGGVLLSTLGFVHGLWLMAAFLGAIFIGQRVGGGRCHGQSQKQKQNLANIFSSAGN